MRIAAGTRARHRVSIPLSVWIAAAVSVAVVAAVLGYPPWESATWSRWDSGLYLDIARDGYDLHRCESEPEKWCGDAGWFPGYPWLAGALHLAGLPVRGTAAVLSWILACGTIVLLWATFLERRTSSAVVAALVYAAFAPGQIYHYAIFPFSLLAFATIACLWCLYRGRYVVAGLAGAGAALAYPSGLVLVPVAGIWLLLQRAPFPERCRRVAITVGLMLVGIWILVVDQRLETGHWDAYLLVQQAFDHELQNPLTGAWEVISNGLEFEQGFVVAAGVQTAFVTLVLAIVLADGIRRRISLQSADSLLLLWALATWALPLSQTTVAVYRGHAALLPLGILVARLPSKLAWVLAVVAIVVAAWIERYFLDGVLI